MSSISTSHIWMLIFGVALAIVVGIMTGASTSLSTSITAPPASCTFELLIPCLNIVAYYLGLVGNVFVIIGAGALNVWTFFPFPFNMLIFAGIVIPIIIFFIQIAKGFV
jgi:hypothetical protein